MLQPLAKRLINHATVLVQVAGLNILTEPMWSKRVSPVTFVGPIRVRDPGELWLPSPVPVN